MITLKKLVLDGWLSYDKAEIDLSASGITRIVGPVGAGKSAILEAVFYLLFGKTIRGKDSVSSLANKVLDNGYLIELQFEVDNVPFLVREVRDRKDKGLYFYIADKDARGKTDPETRKIIIEKLGLSADEFRALAFLGQRQSQILTDGSPAERAAILMDIFGLSRYDDLLSKATDFIKELSVKIDTNKQLKDKMHADIIEYENSIPGELQEDPKLTGKLANADKEVAEERAELDRLQATLEEAIASASKAEEAEKVRCKAAKVKGELQELKTALKGKKEVEGADVLRVETLELEKQRSEEKYKIKIAKEAMEKARCISNECPITNEDCPINVPKNNRAEILNKNNKLVCSGDQVVDKINESIKSATAKLEEAREYDKLIEEFDIKKKVYLDFKQAVSEASDITTLNTAMADLREKVQRQRNKLQESNNKKSELEARQRSIEDNRKTIKRIIQIITKKSEELREAEKKVEEDNIALKYANAAAQVCKKLKIYKIDLVLDSINQNLNEILEKVSNGEYKAEFVSQKQSADSKRTLDKLHIVVYDSQKQLPIELCSGGQATKVGLAILLSTWKTAAELSSKQISSIWLDEVFGPLDEDVINNVFDATVDVTKSLGTTSVHVISHRDLDHRLFDHFWYIRRDNGISIIEMV
jgi:exonuclease SbcC